MKIQEQIEKVKKELDHLYGQRLYYQSKGDEDIAAAYQSEWFKLYKKFEKLQKACHVKEL